MAVCLLAFFVGVLVTGKSVLGLDIASLRTLSFLTLVFGGQATLYAVRDRHHFWGSRPSRWLAASSLADILIAASLAIGGIAMTALPAFVVAGTLAAALLLAIVMATVKVPVFARLGVA